MKVSKIIQPPSLAYQIAGKANKAMNEKKKEIAQALQEKKTEQVKEERRENLIDLLV